MRDNLPLPFFEWMDRQEHRSEDPNQYQRMVRFLARRFIEPTDEFLHPAWRFEWRSSFKQHSETSLIGTNMPRHSLALSCSDPYAPGPCRCI